MGRPGIEHTMVAERITHAVEDDRCDVCGSHRDVAQVICVMESPTGEAGGLANLVLICASCASYIIQVTTGFRAVKTLESWRYVRETHARYKGDRTLVDPEKGEPVG